MDNAYGHASADFVSPVNSRRKCAGHALFILVSVFILSFILGIVGYYLLDMPVTERSNELITSHFSNLLDGCSTFYEGFHTVLSYSMFDIRQMLIIFMAGFTMFCAAAVTAMSVFRGLTLGYSAACLAITLRSGAVTIPYPFLAFISFLFANVLISAAMLSLCSRSLVFSSDYRRTTGRRFAILRSPVFFAHLFGCMTMFGFTLLVNTVRCLLTSVLF